MSVTPGYNQGTEYSGANANTMPPDPARLYSESGSVAFGSTDRMDTVAERVWLKVDRGSDGSCWEWLGPKNHKGYGVARVDGHNRMAHRVVWSLTGRSLTDGLTLDHLCRNRSCVNPGHLEEVPRGVNTLRGETITAANLTKTACPAGHGYSTRGDGTRYCLTCEANRNRASYSRNREAQRQRAKDYYWRKRGLAAMEADRG